MKTQATRTVVAGLILTVPVLLACVLGVAPAPELPASAHSEAPEEIQRLGFIIGEWDVQAWFARPDGTRTEGGTSRISARWILGGVGIETLHHTYGGGPGFVLPPGPPYEEVRVWVYHDPSETVTGSSVNTLGNRKELDGEWKDDRFVVTQSGNLFNERAGYNRMTFSDISEDSFEVRLDIRPDPEQPFIEGVYGYTATRTGG
ncbi:MAG: hypothetical protein DHS20C14_04880 [Phycisphaeraceae bacterium]|nr:MAG: hypothetical protein DHS20C14_04880 [Phycisphaeraceae bacterium]